MLDKKISRKDALEGLEKSLTKYSNKQFGYSGRKQIDRMIRELKEEKPIVFKLKSPNAFSHDRVNLTWQQAMLNNSINQSIQQANRAAINSGLMSMSLAASSGTNPFMFGMM